MSTETELTIYLITQKYKDIREEELTGYCLDDLRLLLLFGGQEADHKEEV